MGRHRYWHFNIFTPTGIVGVARMIMGFEIIIKLVKSLGFFIMGLMAIVVKAINLEIAQFFYSIAIIYSWFLACSGIYPKIDSLLYPTIHLIAIYIYFNIQGRKLIFNITIGGAK